jgi:acyl-CoA thioesterase YciA
MPAEPSDQRYLAIKVVMMPRDTNRHGTIFGGVTLSHIDVAGAVGAQHEARCCGWPEHPFVSVAVNCVEFHQPVFVGDVLSFWTKVVKVGRTSIKMHIDVETERGGETIHVTDATVTYVAVETKGMERRPVPLREEALPGA